MLICGVLGYLVGSQRREPNVSPRFEGLGGRMGQRIDRENCRLLGPRARWLPHSGAAKLKSDERVGGMLSHFKYIRDIVWFQAFESDC